MPKKRSLEGKTIEIIKNLISSENFKTFLAWINIFLSLFFLLLIISSNGKLNEILGIHFKNLFGWSFYFLPFLTLFFSYPFFKKYSWFKVISKLLGIFIIFLIFNFYFYFFFREAGYLNNFWNFLSNLVSSWGMLFLSLNFFLFSFWLILENKFFELLIKIFNQTKKQVEESIKKPTEPHPLKGVRQEIKIKKNNEETPSKPKPTLVFKEIIEKSKWELPPISLLKQSKEEVIAPDINKTSEIIKKTLESFGIKSEIVNVEVGPAITRFSLKPGEGVKLSKILSLQNDIALALGAPNLILETPVPGKAVIGIEVPNLKPAIVKLGNLLNTDEFLNSETLLIFPLGRKINGEVVFADLAKMPHLLIAGTTGSGKSIFIHNILISFLMKNTPETLNLILIDPKRVELIRYQSLPHLLLNPVVDLKKTLSVFNWLINEMDERYKKLEALGARDIDGYNKKLIQRKGKIMPRIVLVIDEMADLMITYGSSVEAMIIRLAQMARATGIHLILATQRPSVDIVTGLIKANIPNRICFKVASQVDSRTVLDAAGAEKLIGSGDGLFISTHLHSPLRIKAPFVTEEEMDRVISFWTKQTEKIPAIEVQRISLEELEKKFAFSSEDLEDEELFKEAVRIVVETGRASTSLLQRKLKIGYARAARLLDLMEERGIVSPPEGSKPRRVLIGPEEIENFFENQENQN